jgi:hypothetical protein
MMTMTTKTKTKSQETQKERKKNWKEVYASVEDIQQFLSDPTGTRRWLPFEVANICPHQSSCSWWVVRT